jgi:1,4-dihydroxy-2-naphthoate polyprenyltransferase
VISAGPAGSRGLGRWFEAARPRTLTAAISPVLVGTAVADRFIAWRFAAALGVALALQVAVNFANDLFDARSGIDSEIRTGPRRTVATGLIAPGAMKIAIGASLLVAGALGTALAIAVGPELFVVGAASAIAALLYSGGPRPYASYGLGEVFVFVFFGLVATAGSAYVQDGSLSQLAYVAAIPVGMLATAILVVNNLRDIETDALSGKRTLMVRIGAPRSRRLYQALVILAFAYAPIVAAVDGSFLPLLALVAAPAAVRPMTLTLYRSQPQELITALAGTARLQLIYCVLLAVGLWVS